MKSQQYGIDEIFEKGLLFLIPFYIFSHESRFKEYDVDKDKLKELQREYKDITDRIEQLLNAGEISEYTKCTIMDMSNKADRAAGCDDLYLHPVWCRIITSQEQYRRIR